MKYPIGIQTFERIINEGYVYVDKTDIISLISQMKKFVLNLFHCKMSMVSTPLRRKGR